MRGLESLIKVCIEVNTNPISDTCRSSYEFSIDQRTVFLPILTSCTLTKSKDRSSRPSASQQTESLSKPPTIPGPGSNIKSSMGIDSNVEAMTLKSEVLVSSLR